MGPRDHLRWCQRQARGLRLTELSENLAAAYLQKANGSLRAMRASEHADILDWAVAAAYYARYQALYALLRKCGIKCEIHDCSIAAFRWLFADRFEQPRFAELELAKEQRIAVHYYPERPLDPGAARKNIASAADFVLAAERLASSLTPDAVAQLRARMQEALR